MKPLLWFLSLLVLLSAPHLASGYYDPGAQRWINRDPLVERGFETTCNLKSGAPTPLKEPAEILEGPNLYRFVGSSPVSLYDSLGLAFGLWPPSDAAIDRCNAICQANGFHAGWIPGPCWRWCAPGGVLEVCPCICVFKKKP
jgi:hypothetical protein